MSKVIVDLFSGTGSATKAFKKHPDWEVFRVEIDEDFDADLHKDVTKVSPEELPDPDVVWASPPCTCFSVASIQHYWSGETLPQQEKVAENVKMVYHTLWLIEELEPDYWFMENPRGMMRKVMPFKPEGTVTYCQYGFDWQKPTDLWGEHPESLQYESCSPGDNCHQEAGRGFDSGVQSSHIRDPAERAKIPEGLSRSILEAVENSGPKTKQVKLSR